MPEKIPLRRCMGCNQTKPKTELLRIVRDPNGNIFIDTGKKADGRGAYICKNKECLKKCRKSGRIAKMLSLKVPDEIYNSIEEMIKNADG